MKIGETLEARQPEDFAAWLAANAGQKQEIWLIIYKKASGKQTVAYEQLVEVALCYGWIDGIVKGMDAEKYAQRFSPRRKRSNWTAANMAIAQRLIAAGRMTKSGHAALPEDLRQAFKSDQLLDP